MSLLTGRYVPYAALRADEIDAMYLLLDAHFDGTRRDDFLHDLSEKTGVILLEDRKGSLVGFSTLLLYQTSFREEPITVIFSGDTIVDRSHWGTLKLHKSWVEAVRRILGETAGKVYWLLISSGYRTYRFLPLFFREFYPRFDATTPMEVQSLIDSLASARFGTDYDPEEGIVRFSRSRQILRPGISEISAERLRDPHIAFFASRNPGYTEGDELVCLTEMSDENLRPAGRRMAGAFTRRFA